MCNRRTNSAVPLFVIAIYLCPAATGQDKGLPKAELITRVTNAYPAYSPDAKRVAYMSNAGGEWKLALDGGNSTLPQ
ncbi:MAG TPA: hypothetical protein VGA55_08375 [Bacteroidota bacterium]